MNEKLLIAAIFLPAVGGLFQHFLPNLSEKMRKTITAGTTIFVSLFVFALLLFCGPESVYLFSFTDGMDFVLRLDGLGKFFCAILALLWPLTTFYAFGYLDDESKYPSSFFMFFLFAYGSALGVAMSGTLLTMYCFYELLTLSTMPLVLHYMNSASIRAAKIYLAYSLGGAAFGLMAMVFLHMNGISLDFSSGGIQNFVGNKNVFLVFYVVGFFGFGVKSAVFPFYSWLPTVAVAPTPVTALLHAVAVVKAGVFSVMRYTYYIFGASFLIGTWAQDFTMMIAAFTVLFGSAMALKEQHFKRRLAYSTVANLSYILLGVSFMSEVGFYGALMHMFFHAIIKILAFFCCGAVMHKAGITYVNELNGMGKRMPITFICFTIASISLSSVPPFSSFVSKWDLLVAAVSGNTLLGYIGAAALILSALFTAMYMLSVTMRAFFLKGENSGGKCEAENSMVIPMIILAIFAILFGVYSLPLEVWARAIAQSVI